jgi:hypothetical protein
MTKKLNAPTSEHRVMELTKGRESRLRTTFDPVKAGRAIDAEWAKWKATKEKLDEHDNALREMLLEAKANVPDFKAFVLEYTTIAYSTAKRTLAIADGRGDEVRAQERERQRKHRDKVVALLVKADPKIAEIAQEQEWKAPEIEQAIETLSDKRLTNDDREAMLEGMPLKILADGERAIPKETMHRKLASHMAAWTQYIKAEHEFTMLRIQSKPEQVIEDVASIHDADSREDELKEIGDELSRMITYFQAMLAALHRRRT